MVALAVVDDQDCDPQWGPGVMPRSVRVVDEATAELVADMLHDATATAAVGDETGVDLDAVIDRAARARGDHPS